MNVKDIEKLTTVPLAKPGFDALEMSAPVLVQMNPDGKWENSKPGNLDAERLKALVQHLVNSKAVSAAQSYCCQCASESQVLSVFFSVPDPGYHLTPNYSSRLNERVELTKLYGDVSFIYQVSMASGHLPVPSSDQLLVIIILHCHPVYLRMQNFTSTGNREVDQIQLARFDHKQTSGQKDNGKSSYVPIIMMPIYPADQCPFGLECEIQKEKENQDKKTINKTAFKEQEKDSSKDKTMKKIKKRQFVMQRLTDFDLLSQW